MILRAVLYDLYEINLHYSFDLKVIVVEQWHKLKQMWWLPVTLREERENHA